MAPSSVPPKAMGKGTECDTCGGEGPSGEVAPDGPEQHSNAHVSHVWRTRTLQPRVPDQGGRQRRQGLEGRTQRGVEGRSMGRQDMGRQEGWEVERVQRDEGTA